MMEPVAQAAEFRLDADQEIALGMWDAAPAPILKGMSGYPCKLGAESACGVNLCCGTAKKAGSRTGIDICHTATAQAYTGKDQIEMTF